VKKKKEEKHDRTVEEKRKGLLRPPHGDHALQGRRGRLEGKRKEGRPKIGNERKKGLPASPAYKEKQLHSAPRSGREKKKGEVSSKAKKKMWVRP